MLSIVVPIHNCFDQTRTFFESVMACSYLPEEIIVIDNNSTDASETIPVRFGKDLPIKYIKNNRNIGVNPSWMQGYEIASGDIIGFWNNDIVVCPHIFSHIEKVFEEELAVGMVVPEVINQDFLVRNSVPPTGLPLENYYEREGWCFTMRKRIIDKGGKIPPQLINSAGDDWLYNITRDFGYRRVRMLGVPIKHWGSATISSMGGWVYLEEQVCPDDLNNWSKIKNEKGWT